MKKLLLFLIIVLLAAPQVLSMGTAPHLPGIVDLQGKINNELIAMDGDLASAAARISALGLQSDGTAKILQKIYDDHNSVVDVVTVGLDGHLLLIQPRTYKSSEGSFIGNQQHFQQLVKTKKPVVSPLFKTVEGFWASLAYPVFSPQGKLIGCVSIVFKPDALMGNIIKQYISVTSSVDAMALELDGKVIYDKDILQVGRMTFFRSRLPAVSRPARPGQEDSRGTERQRHLHFSRATGTAPGEKDDGMGHGRPARHGVAADHF